MGLDMYLTRTTRFHGMEPEMLALMSFPPIVKAHRVRTVTEELGYWRKANAIHAWFVREVQNGTDDCGTYTVQKYHLEKLLDLTGRILDDPMCASRLLAPQDGFFFGSTTYDDDFYYWQIEVTSRILIEALDDFDDTSSWYEYRSSW